MLGSPNRASWAISKRFDPFSPQWSSSVSVGNSANHRSVTPAELLSDQFAHSIVGFLERKDPPKNNTHTIARSATPAEQLPDSVARSIVDFLEPDNLPHGIGHSIDRAVISAEQLHNRFEQNMWAQEPLHRPNYGQEVQSFSRASFSPFVTHSAEISQPLPVRPIVNFPFHYDEPPHFIQPVPISVQLLNERATIHQAISKTSLPSQSWQYLPALKTINNQLHSNGIEVERLSTPIPSRSADRLLSDQSGLRREIVKQINNVNRPSRLFDKLARIENELERRIALDPSLPERNARTYQARPKREFYA